MSRRPWSHYAAPAAFLLAATVAVFVIRAAVDHRSGGEPAPATVPTAPPPPAATTGSSSTSTPTPPARTQPQLRSYTVVAGDTFSVISQKTGVSVEQIRQLNPGVSSNTLFIGQKIRIG